MSINLKIMHIADLHYSIKYLDKVDRCFSHAIEVAIREECKCAIIAGDLFEHRIDHQAPAVSALVERFSLLAQAMPVLILAGTSPHDPPGCLDGFKTVRAKNPVFVADQICQVALGRSDRGSWHWIKSSDKVTNIENFIDPYMPGSFKAFFSCLPPMNKGSFACELVTNLLKAWSVSHLECRKYKIPSVIVSHGTVSGATTEYGVVMHGLDHEFVTETLFASEASAVMLGHIDQMQTWQKNARMIACPGSPWQLHFGEVADKGFLIWNIDKDSATCEFHKTPAKTGYSARQCN